MSVLGAEGHKSVGYNSVGRSQGLRWVSTETPNQGVSSGSGEGITGRLNRSPH